MADWTSPLPPREGRGIAMVESFGSIVGEVAHVAVSPEGALRVKHVYAAVDCGDVVNTDAATAQVEGGIIFGLSAAMKGEITIAEGRVVESNFHDHEMIHLADAPQITVEFIRSGHAPGRARRAGRAASGLGGDQRDLRGDRDPGPAPADQAPRPAVGDGDDVSGHGPGAHARGPVPGYCLAGRIPSVQIEWRVRSRPHHAWAVRAAACSMS